MTKKVMFIVKGKVKDIDIMKDVSKQFGRIFSKEQRVADMEVHEDKLQSQKQLEEKREEEKNSQEFVEQKEVKRQKAWLDYLEHNPAIV